MDIVGVASKTKAPVPENVSVGIVSTPTAEDIFEKLSPYAVHEPTLEYALALPEITPPPATLTDTDAIVVSSAAVTPMIVPPIIPCESYSNFTRPKPPLLLLSAPRADPPAVVIVPVFDKDPELTR
jgi:hypothetical protein